MFGTHSLESVREKKRDPAQAPPLVLGRGNKLIDVHLRHICEITKLSFPSNEAVGPIQTVSILEAHDSRLRQWTVVNLHGRLIGGQVLKRHKAIAVFHVVQHGMAMTECTAFGILS